MLLERYMRWLHTGWPAGTVERLPAVSDDGTTAVPGVRVVGDLTGVPLLKLAADSGARAVHALRAEADFERRRLATASDDAILDVAIVGAGVSGIAAAIEAKQAGLRYAVFEAAEPWNTVANFPKAKPIFTYPTAMKPAGSLQVSAPVKEALLDELEAERRAAGVEITRAFVSRIERKGAELLVHCGEGAAPRRALRVIVAIGRTGNYRKLGVPGEHLDKVFQRLYDPHDHAGKTALVVGGGDSAIETAVALALAGAHVTLSYRNRELPRPKAENVARLRALEADPRARVGVERPTSERVSASMPVNLAPPAMHGSLRTLPGSHVAEIRPDVVALTDEAGEELTLPNDVVFAMIGREPPLDFFRRSGIPIRGEWRPSTYVGLALFFAACLLLYAWKADTALNHWWSAHRLFPFNLGSLGDSPLARALTDAARQPGFYYSLAYTIAIGLFGWKRVRRRKTPYVTAQTAALFAIQFVPLFLLPYIVLPWLGNAGFFAHGMGKSIGDALFPDGSYWRAFGLVLAWPLFIWNFFNDRPIAAWLVLGSIQTFVLIPLLVRRWGKGAYCGWICSCGALAETLGDTQRHKMPHGPVWNRLNMVGQAILAICFILFAMRTYAWYAPGSMVAKAFEEVFYSHSLYDYYHVVDLFLAGVVGLGFYFWASGRVWCRFACPLAALMHIYARFSQFRIFAEKKKCISCNVCTSVCHQGIDVMSFANKGLPMADPECVRCSACVHACPTGVLSFGRFGEGGAPVLDRLGASPVQLAERQGDGKAHLRVLA